MAIENENLLLLVKAAVEVPGRPHASTLVRWALRGVRGVKLETWMVGGRRFTSVEAVQRFLQRLNQPRSILSPSRPQRGHRDLDQIDRFLDEEGIK